MVLKARTFFLITLVQMFKTLKSITNILKLSTLVKTSKTALRAFELRSFKQVFLAEVRAKTLRAGYEQFSNF